MRDKNFIITEGFASSNISLDTVCMERQNLFSGKTLRKHVYSNILEISPPKKLIFPIKNSDIFHISAQNIDCGYSLEPPR